MMGTGFSSGDGDQWSIQGREQTCNEKEEGSSPGKRRAALFEKLQSKDF
jgi:hypothetical protein